MRNRVFGIAPVGYSLIDINCSRMDASYVGAYFTSTMGSPAIRYTLSGDMEIMENLIHGKSVVSQSQIILPMRAKENVAYLASKTLGTCASEYKNERE